MPRRSRVMADVQRKFGMADGPRRPRRRRHELRNGLDYMEVLSTVCKFLCQGNTISEIIRLVKERHGVQLSREEPYQYLNLAASRGWIEFKAPLEHVLRERIRKVCHWMEDVDVVHTAVADDVASRGASMLYGVIRKHFNKGVVHVGFAGGHTMRKLVQDFAELLREPATDLPQTLVCHSLVCGFEVNNPTTDPNSFFTYLVKDVRMQVDTKFVGLYAPPVVLAGQVKSLRKLRSFQIAEAASHDLDIVVTSAGLWADKDSMLRKYYYENSRKSFQAMEDAGCIADIFWRPISRTGPIETPTLVRAMTLLELGDLPKFIDRKKYVLLVLGPCGACGAPKGPILEAVMTMPQHLVTHMVVDTRTARTGLAAQ